MALSQEHIDNILSRKRRPSNPGSVLLDIIEEAILVNEYEHVDEANIKGLLNEEPIASVNGEFKTWSVN